MLALYIKYIMKVLCTDQKLGTEVFIDLMIEVIVFGEPLLKLSLLKQGLPLWLSW